METTATIRPVRVAVLGPVEVDGRAVASRRVRAALCALVIHHGRDVTTDGLIEALWAEHVPATAEKSLRNTIVELRRLVGTTTIVTTPSGYRLVLDPHEIDAAAVTGATPEQVLALWRGTPYDDVADWPAARAERARLSALRDRCEEARYRVAIDAGRHEEVIGELEAIVLAHPLREGPWQLLMVALYRAGRQRDALLAFDRLRRTLVTEAGVEPSPASRRIEAAILLHDPLLDAARETSLPNPLASSLAEGWHLAGRGTALAALRRAWSEATAGRARAQLVVGEAGAGKTRLVAEASRLAVADGALVLYGRCEEDGSAPFEPIATALRAWLDRPGNAAVDLPAPMRLLLPGLERPGPDAAGDDPSLVFAAVAAWLVGIARTQPVVFVVDDVHWGHAEHRGAAAARGTPVDRITPPVAADGAGPRRAAGRRTCGGARRRGRGAATAVERRRRRAARRTPRRRTRRRHRGLDGRQRLPRDVGRAPLRRHGDHRVAGRRTMGDRTTAPGAG